MVTDVEWTELLGKEVGKLSVFNLRLLEMLVFKGVLTTDEALLLVDRLEVDSDTRDQFREFFLLAQYKRAKI
jgi:hypothetical protein